MEKIFLRPKKLMTYEQWAILHAKRNLRVRLKKVTRKLRRGFVRTWSRGIDWLEEISANTDAKEVAMSVAGIAGGIVTATLFFALLGFAGKSDLEAEGFRAERGIYSNGYVIIDDYKYPVDENMALELEEGEKVSVTLNINYIDDPSDDTVHHIEGWKWFN